VRITLFPTCSRNSVLFSTLWLLCLYGSSCSDHVDTSVRLKLQVILESPEGYPVAFAQVWLADHHRGLGTQPEILRRPVCTTDESGGCSAVIEYAFEFSDWFWRRVVSKPSGSEPGYTPPNRFEFSVATDGKKVPIGFLPPLNGAQLQGLETIDCKIIVVHVQ